MEKKEDEVRHGCVAVAELFGGLDVPSLRRSLAHGLDSLGRYIRSGPSTMGIFGKRPAFLRSQ